MHVITSFTKNIRPRNYAILSLRNYATTWRVSARGPKNTIVAHAIYGQLFNMLIGI
jgi:hypothetical protein